MKVGDIVTGKEKAIWVMGGILWIDQKYMVREVIKSPTGQEYIKIFDSQPYGFLSADKFIASC